MFRSVLVPINRAGWPFIAAALVAALLLGLLWSPLFWLGLLGAAFCTYFFRDPPRVTPSRPGLVIAPADGMVQMIESAPPPPELEMGDAPLTRISIFLNVFNVHVNRVPLDGKISAVSYRPGKFLNAAMDKASVDNERMSLKVTSYDGVDLAFVQIAGLVARRIICNVSLGQPVRAGQVFGLIRFGSRMDVYLPEGVSPLVVPHQTAIAGETVIADLLSQESARQGEER
ncbi:phosphatidylserine decarboxylase [Pelagibius litoralis]|uniref:phosphatidylserine decarboxylase n=1 Tax=Pelagibius litoralis TaxID=374515 RepID=UPI002AC31519|nr:phosphatidylserine decarboxylase [Pelagibius litoralis]